MSVIGATNTVGGVLPSLMKYLMRTASLSLNQVFLVYILSVACSGIGCYYCACDLDEYRAQAKKVLGLPLPRPPQELQLKKRLRSAHEVLRVHWIDHMFFIAALAPFVAMSIVYGTSIGDYATELFKDRDAGERMAALYANMNAGLGVLLTPMLSMVGDKCGHALHLLVVIMTISSLTSTLFVGFATWSAQITVSICCAVSGGAVNLLIQRYTLAYAMPSQIGAVMGVICTYVIILSILITSAFDAVIIDRPLAVPYTILSFIATVIVEAFCVRFFFVVGLPATPVLLPSDESELADPFGCRDINEVAYVTHKSRDEVIKLLSSSSIEDVTGLIQSIDYDRMQEKISDNTDQLKDMCKDSVKPTDTSPGHLRKWPTASTMQEALQSPSSLQSAPSRNSNLSTVPPAHFESSRAVVEEKIMDVARQINSWWMLLFGGYSTACVTVDAPLSITEPLLREYAPFEDPPGSFLGCMLQCVRRKTHQPGGAAQARALNEELVAAVRAGDRATVLAIYEVEDPELLWQAYQDLFDFVPDMDTYENRLEERVPDDEFVDIINRRPALKVVAMKMVALRSKKKLFG
eukprot:TRINITY_DN29882_c0_g1_i1.p1 TRINITY_DN29882_c0_g1~~TRINITY_DN29882_c0_g1_i1.p1  ORF type:complete len:578 (-),score=60.81 TRINITY_DN29882_c0_g1_i1:168-1901(-)